MRFSHVEMQSEIEFLEIDWITLKIKKKYDLMVDIVTAECYYLYGALIICNISLFYAVNDDIFRDSLIWITMEKKNFIQKKGAWLDVKGLT